MRLRAAFAGLCLIAVLGFVMSRPPMLDHAFLFFYDHANQEQRETVATVFSHAMPFAHMADLLDAQNPVCHSEAHPLGHVVYRTTQSLPDALAICRSTCSYGCFHGVLMELFSTQSDSLGGALTGTSDTDIFTQIIQSVPDFCSRNDVSSVVVPWVCLHGIGHVIMYLSKYDIPHALSVCKELPNAAEAAICAGGAFMEYIRSDSNTALVTERNLFPCDQYPEFAKSCFVYKGQPMVNAFGSAAAAISACRAEALPSELLACIRGVGVGAATLDMLKKPGGLDPVCGALSGDERAACIDGAVVSVVFRMEAGAPVCSEMATPYDQYCAAESQQMQGLILQRT